MKNKYKNWSLRLLYVLGMTIGLMGHALAQDQPIRGIVKAAETGELLPGVNVVIKGTQTGTTTNADGRFSLTASPAATLVISSVGYQPQEVVLKAQTTVTISLVSDARSLNEVVVVGYGTVKKSDLTGAVGVATPKDFGDVNVSSVSQLVQGKLAGVQVVNNSGLPGSGTRIVIRGTGTFTNSDPLYVIDGIQSDGNTFNSLSPYDVQDITVLKDASSIAIYGARGANGVVLVTTKRAKVGTPRITYTGYVGFAKAWKQLDLLNASQYIDLVKDIATTQETALPAKLTTPDVLVDRTDWQKEMFRTAKLTEHYINVSGGTEKMLYSVSAGYTTQQSTVIGRTFERFNLRANLEENVGRRIRLGQNLNIRYSITTGNTPDFVAGLRMPPYAPIYDPTNLGGFSKVTTINDLNDSFNPLTGVYLTENKGRDLLNYAQFFGEIDLIQGLKFRSQVSLNFSNASGYNYAQASQNGNLTNPNGITEYYSYSISPLLENILTYNRAFGQKHSLTLLAGNTYQKGVVYRSLNVNGSNFPNDDIRQVGVAPLSSITGGSAGQSSLLSYFARANYTLLNKYLVTLSLRRDGSPVFGAANRFGNFPSAAVAWKIAEEPFMKSIPFITDLKVRASWGKSGNSSIAAFLDQPLVSKGASNNIVYSFGADKSYVQGSTITSASNPNLRWEETVQTDVGLDVGLFNNHVSLTLDYYNRQNNGLLVYVPIPLSTGVGAPGSSYGTLPQNAASGYNRGIEVTAAYNGQAGGLRYSVSANGAYNKNEVTSLGTQGATPIISGASGSGNFTRTDVGYPIGSFWGYKVDHVAIDKADVAKYGVSQEGTSTYQSGLQPGDFIFRDLNGDGKVDEKDQTFLGSPIPKWNYGLNLNLAYKSFDLMVSLQGVAGVQLANVMRYNTQGTSRPFNSITAVLNRWRKEGDVAAMFRAGQNANSSGNLRPSDWFVEDGAYTRLRNMTLGYTLNSAFLKKATSNTVSSLRLYITAQNLFTITKYSGYDPEVGPVDPNNASTFLFSRGLDQGQYPQPRTFIFGIQLGF